MPVRCVSVFELLQLQNTCTQPHDDTDSTYYGTLRFATKGRAPVHVSVCMAIVKSMKHSITVTVAPTHVYFMWIEKDQGG